MTKTKPKSPLNRPATVLIVDDIEVNLNLLHILVSSLGHVPVPATNGREALSLLQQHQPDLVLLDILMPDMDGFQVLTAIRQAPQFRKLPVVVISAISEMDSIVKCIQLGADDYLTKPFNKTLLEARIQNCLEKKYWLDQESHYLQKINHRRQLLERLIIEKENELTAVYQTLHNINKTKSEFVRIISHELRTPLNSLLGPSKYLLDQNVSLELRKESAELFSDALEQFKEIVEHAELLVQLELKDKKHYQNYALIDTALMISAHHLQKYAHLRQVDLPEMIPNNLLVIGDESLLAQGFEVLFKLAIKFSSPKTTLSIQHSVSNNFIQLSIFAKGWSVPEKYKETFFNLFGVTETIVPGGDLGLAPPVINSIFKYFEGDVSFQNLNPTGVCFKVTLPVVSNIDRQDLF